MLKLKFYNKGKHNLNKYASEERNDLGDEFETLMKRITSIEIVIMSLLVLS